MLFSAWPSAFTFGRVGTRRFRARLTPASLAWAGLTPRTSASIRVFAEVRGGSDSLPMSRARNVRRPATGARCRAERCLAVHLGKLQRSLGFIVGGSKNVTSWLRSELLTRWELVNGRADLSAQAWIALPRFDRPAVLGLGRLRNQTQRGLQRKVVTTSKSIGLETTSRLRLLISMRPPSRAWQRSLRSRAREGRRAFSNQSGATATRA